MEFSTEWMHVSTVKNDKVIRWHGFFAARYPAAP